MQTLELNVNVQLARVLLGKVSESSGIDSYLLLEDDGFCQKLTEYAHKLTIADGYARLMNYIDENY